MEDNYIPGVCNIGKAEKRFRLYSGLFCLVCAITIYGFIKLFEFSDLFFIPLAFLIFFGVLNIFQASSSFCVKFAISNRYNFGSFGNSTKINSPTVFNKDLAKSIKLIIQASIITLLTMITLLLLR